MMQELSNGTFYKNIYGTDFFFQEVTGKEQLQELEEKIVNLSKIYHVMGRVIVQAREDGVTALMPFVPDGTIETKVKPDVEPGYSIEASSSEHLLKIGNDLYVILYAHDS